jgi:ABC-type transporter Mla subunit MlaD
MNTTPPNAVMFVLLFIAVVLAVVAWLIVQRQRSLRLRRRFGPQYDLTVSEFHSRPRADTELLNVRNTSSD